MDAPTNDTTPAYIDEYPTVQELAIELWLFEQDLRRAWEWLADKADALTAAGAATPTFYVRCRGSGLIELQCPTASAWAAVSRVLLVGVGRPGLTKEVASSFALATVRSFGRVSVRAWIPQHRVCTPLPSDGDEERWDCSGVRVLAGAAGRR